MPAIHDAGTSAEIWEQHINLDIADTFEGIVLKPTVKVNLALSRCHRGFKPRW